MSYYLEKGYNLTELCNLSPAKKTFYKASMLFNIERRMNEKQEFIKLLYGVK